MRAARITLLCLAMLLTLGCSGKTIVGTWERTGAIGSLAKFGSDGMCSFESVVFGQSIEVRVRYKVEENKLHLSGPQLRQNGQEIQGRLAETARAAMPQEFTLQISWKSKDEIVLSGFPMLEGNWERVR